MKRSDALAALSRDHHHGLFAAHRLRNATPDNAAAARDEFLAFWHTEGRGHFRVEEEVLLPSLARHGLADHDAVVKVLLDHVELRRRAADLFGDPTAPVSTLHELGERLHTHIRHEERVLFPLVEQVTTDADLAELAAGIERAEGAWLTGS
jgi:iron-sulfur cluster repair protein YtfE (RIC family)